MSESLYRYHDGPMHGHPCDTAAVRDAVVLGNGILIVSLPYTPGGPRRAYYKVDQARLLCTYLRVSR